MSAPDEDRQSRLWHWVGRAFVAHLVMLRDVGLIDDDALSGVVQGIDSTQHGLGPETPSLISMIRTFDERLDAVLPPGLAGVARVGRGTIDVAATAVRAVLRDQVLDVEERLLALRGTLIELASVHAVSLMPTHIDGQIAQPTTFGHLLAGTVSQLGRAATRLDAAYGTVNLSPLGAVALASTGMPIDRERLTDLLGFDGLLENTFDAVSATDGLVAVADALDAIAVPIRRLAELVLIWVRAEPNSVRLADDWTMLLGELPQTRLPIGLTNLIADLSSVSAAAATARSAANDVQHGPLAGELDRVARPIFAVAALAGAAVDRAAEFFNSGFEVNRAILANRAGKGFSTSSDLADFLMIEEQIEPGAAQNIAALTMSRAREEGLEASGITSELIDGAALLVIGREVKAEFEAISRYLAPRRFVERRNAPGAPSPAAVRAHLDAERSRLAHDSQRRQQAIERLTRADAELSRLESEALAPVRG